MLGGNAVPTPGGYEGSGVWGYYKDVDKERYPFDPAKAKALLAEAGVKPGPINILSAKGRLLNDAEVVQAIAGMLQNIGFTPQIQLAGLHRRQRRVEPQVPRGDRPAPLVERQQHGRRRLQLQHQLLHQEHRPVLGHAEMDAMVVKARSTLDTRSREAQYQEIGKKLLDEAVAVPMYDQVDSYGTSKRLKGFQARADELMYLYPATLEG